MAKEGTVVCGFVFVVLVLLYELGLGIAEAVFVAKYSDFSHECRSIWEWILAACVFNIVIPALTLCFSFGESTNKLIVQFARIGQVIIAIWSAITYYHITTSCRDFWTSNAPELYTFVMIHFVMLWIFVGIVGLLIIMACLAVCCGGSAAISDALGKV